MSSSQRTLFATALSVQRNRDTRPIFELLLNDPEPSVRSEAVDSLFEDDANFGCADLLLNVLEKPGSRLLPHEAMNRRLQSYRGDSASAYRSRFLITLQAAKAPDLQVLALSLLGSNWGPGCADAVRPFTTSDNPWVRRAALYSLGNNEPDALENIRDQIAGDTSPAVRLVLPALHIQEYFPWKTYFSESESRSTSTHARRSQRTLH